MQKTADFIHEDHWTETNSDEFIRYGHLFFPQDAKVNSLITRLIENLDQDAAIVELGCGSGHLLHSLLERFPMMTALAIDKSPTMLNAAMKNCLVHSGRIRFQESNLEDDGILTSRNCYHSAISILAIHHLFDAEKRKLYEQIHGSLREGGLFVYCDMFMPTTSSGLAIAASEWENAVSDQAAVYGEPDALDKFRQLRWNYYANPQGDPSDRPSPIIDTILQLRDVGFSQCDLHWFTAGHGLITAQK